MCPVLVLFLFILLLLLVESTITITVSFVPVGDWKEFKEGENRTVYFSSNDYIATNKSYYRVISDQPEIADIVGQTLFLNTRNGSLNGSFVINGKFLGISQVRLISEGENADISNSLEVKILKVKGEITKAFTYCVVILVSLNYINMGCALDLNVVMAVVRKPIAPLVGFFCQYLVMPLVSYGLARALFTDTVLQLGLFTFGCSPGGGASNMWTVLLKGNLNLSLTMTFISGLAALGMVPLWLFTLGRTLFSGMKVGVPYDRILGTLCIMVVTLGIGVCIQKYKPGIARVCKRMLAPVCVFMILVIIIFGTYANLYMFRLFTLRVVIAACFNVWLGFTFGAVASRLFKLSKEDTIAIAIETGVQNTGIAFVLLSVSLPQPESDLAAVVPVASSIVTPIPLILIYLFQKIWIYWHRSKSNNIVLCDDHNAEMQAALPSPSSTCTTESLSTSKFH